MPQKTAVLISGRGSNMESLARSPVGGAIAVVLSNRPDVEGVTIARRLGLATETIDHHDFLSREEFEEAMINRLSAYQPDLVVLAGFMRVLTPLFIRHFQGRLINIHPALLPSFPGVNTHQRALNAGVRVHGCTVHFVNEVVDGGAIIAQSVVPVLTHDNEQSLAKRVLIAEHRLLPQAVAAWLAGDYRWSEHGVKWRVEGKQTQHQAERHEEGLMYPQSWQVEPCSFMPSQQ
jgi:phosphoribosylglycinamide formyltransferase-1